MGGQGSTRWGYRTPRSIVEDCQCTLDADHFHRSGLFAPPIETPQVGTITWNSGAGTAFNLESDVNSDLILTLEYAIGNEVIHLSVEMQSTLLSSGGLRWWFKCPLVCKRRVRKLYLPSGTQIYGCRHCYGLTHWCRRTGYNRRQRIVRLLAGKYGNDLYEVINRWRRIKSNLSTCHDDS